jgi:hypothetical protein
MTKVGIAIATGVLATGGMAIAATYPLRPAEPLLPPAGPDTEIVQAYCSGCHSVDYITTQPLHKGRQFWQDTVTKMITAYGAPVPPDDAARIVTYLEKTR